MVVDGCRSVESVVISNNVVSQSVVELETVGNKAAHRITNTHQIATTSNHIKLHTIRTCEKTHVY